MNEITNLPADFVRNTEFVRSDEDTDSTTPMEKDAR